MLAAVGGGAGTGSSVSLIPGLGRAQVSTVTSIHRPGVSLSQTELHTDPLPGDPNSVCTAVVLTRLHGLGREGCIPFAQRGASRGSARCVC